jgi:hypothetical protein
MATSTKSGKLLKASNESKASASSGKASKVDPDFATEWNEADKIKRRQIRRLVRIGRPQENAADAHLAVGFAAYQRSRPWYRLFWFWFIPVVVAGVIAGFAIHPIVIGMVLAVAANALIVRRAFKKAEWLNEPLLTETA